MEERLQHDPRTKVQIKETLYSFLYNPIERHLKAQLDAIIVKNALTQGNTNYAFTYKGALYSVEAHPLLRNVNKLSPLLRPMMDEYLKEVTELNSTELPYVLGFINKVLNSSNSLQDYLLILPESVHQPIQKLVNQCPCREHVISQDTVKKIKSTNKVPIDLIKQRMLSNLLI